jgi:hypothetical protein
MIGGSKTNSTISGAISIGGRPGTSARKTPPETSRMDGEILSRSAATEIAAMTARRNTKV